MIRDHADDQCLHKEAVDLFSVCKYVCVYVCMCVCVYECV